MLQFVTSIKKIRKRNISPAFPANETEKHGLKVGHTISGVILNVEENRLDITDLYEMYYELKKENAELKQQLADLEINTE